MGRDALGMTREHKLALILGFALVLLVGVLVSDHISGSQRTVASSQTMDDPIRAIESELGPGLGQTASRSRDRAMPGLQAPPLEMELASSERTNDSMINDLRRVVSNRVDDILASPPPHAGQTTTEVRIPEARTPINERSPGVIEMGSRPDSGDPRDRGNGSAEQPAASVRTHRVEARETLWSIAEKFYGDGKLSTELARWNADRIGSGSTIQPGASLVIPSRSELAGGAAPRATEPVREVRVPSSNEARPADRPAANWVYVVKRGDVLGTIAQRELGTMRRMDEIMKLNTDKISSPDQIWVGLELRMPPR